MSKLSSFLRKLTGKKAAVLTATGAVVGALSDPHVVQAIAPLSPSVAGVLGIMPEVLAKAVTLGGIVGLLFTEPVKPRR